MREIAVDFVYSLKTKRRNILLPSDFFERFKFSLTYTLLCGFLLSSSPPLEMNFNRLSADDFGRKIFAGKNFQPLFVHVVLCHLHGKLLVIH